MRSAFISVTTTWPPVLVTAIQVAMSCLVSFLLAHLTTIVAHLTPLELAYVWIPLTGLYFTGLKEAEKKWPRWTWLLYLLPTKLPQ